MPDRLSVDRLLRAMGVIACAALLCLVAIPMVRADAAAPTNQVSAGSISWGLKASFRNYVTGPIAHGKLTSTAPATDNGTQTTWAGAAGDWADSGADVAASGGVNYFGHDGDLNLTLANPRLVVNGPEAELRVDTIDTAGTKTAGLAIVEVDLAGAVTSSAGHVTIAGASTTLTAAGATFMGGFYPAGTAMDALDARFEVAVEATTEPTTEPTTQPTTEPTTQPTTEPTTQPTTEPTTQPTTGPTGKVTAGSISWGLRQSFRSYVVGPIAHGRITAAKPAKLSPDHVVTYPNASGSWTSATKAVAARGGVAYYGHGGELNLRFSSPQLKVSGAKGTLLVDVIDSTGVSHDDVPFADVTLTDTYLKQAADGVTVVGAPTTLTARGATVMNGFYAAGATLDPLTAAFAFDDAAVPTVAPPIPSPRPEPTKKSTKKPSPVKKTGQAGALTWGVKTSFRSYITGPIAHGSVTVSGGATATTGGYRFGQSSTTAAPPKAVGTTGYRGAVRFLGHAGELDMTFSDLSVRVTSNSAGMLTGVVAGRGRLDLAVLDLSRGSRSTAAGWVQYAGVPAALTPSGSGLFSYNGSSFYPAGTPVDPVTFSVGSAATATSSSGGSAVVAASATDSRWTPPATPPATTGLRVRQGEVSAGGAITVSGTGFAPGEADIKVVLYSTPVVLAEDVTADATGRAKWSGTIPATIEPGKHTLTFQGTVDRGVVIDVAEADALVGCQLQDGRLDWGFKESFRAYVSGSIANGDWSESGNASYETPQFSWVQGAGVVDEKTGSGELGFTGAVRFTGHDGALDTTIARPVVRFSPGDAAVLSVDYAGATMDAAMAGDDTREKAADVPFADLDLAGGTRTEDGTTVTIADIPTTLTSAGSAAFPNYETGAALDPVTLTFTVSKTCTTGQVAEAGPEAAATNVAGAVAPAAGSDLPAWLPWIGGALLGGAIAVAGMLLGQRRRGGAGA